MSLNYFKCLLFCKLHTELGMFVLSWMILYSLCVRSLWFLHTYIHFWSGLWIRYQQRIVFSLLISTHEILNISKSRILKFNYVLRFILLLITTLINKYMSLTSNIKQKKKKVSKRYFVIFLYLCWVLKHRNH